MSDPSDDIYTEYVQLHERLAKDRYFDEATKSLPILYATQYLADRITAETDRLIEALSRDES